MSNLNIEGSLEFNALGGGALKVLCDALYPVGAVYLTISENDFSNFLGGEWVKISEGYALWTASSGAGETISAGLPNITGAFQGRPIAGNAVLFTYPKGGSGAFIQSGNVGDLETYRGSHNSTQDLKNAVITLDASRANSIYGNSTTVQPPAYKIYAWRRKT